MDNINKNEIRTTAMAGSHITDCITEAIVLAIQEDVVVVLKHNEAEYTADPAQIRATVARKTEQAQ